MLLFLSTSSPLLLLVIITVHRFTAVARNEQSASPLLVAKYVTEESQKINLIKL